LNADNKPPYSYPVCPSTPSFALTNLVNKGKARAANDDVTTVRVATTTDGINFQGPQQNLWVSLGSGSWPSAW